MTTALDITDSSTPLFDPAVLTDDRPAARPVAPELLWLIGRVGLATLLMTNAIYAFVAPESFEAMLSSLFILGGLPAPLIGLLVVGAGLNDALLAIFVLVRPRTPFVWAWVGAWFVVVALVKLAALI